MTKNDIINREYENIKEIWKFEHKWLEKLPLEQDDYDTMIDEANEIARKFTGEYQKTIVQRLNAYTDSIGLFDKKIKEAEK